MILYIPLLNNTLTNSIIRKRDFIGKGRKSG
jgi:hypothetical protein